jgi:hypothetical protein
MLSSDDFRWRAWGAHLLCTWGPQLPETLTWLEKAIRDHTAGLAEEMMAGPSEEDDV